MTTTSLASTTSLAPGGSVPLADLPRGLPWGTPTGLPRGLTLDDALRVAAAVDAAHAESTRTVYAHAWRVWERWCTSRGICSLPAEPAALSAYLVERAAAGIAVASLNMAMHRYPSRAPPARSGQPRRARARPTGPPRTAPHHGTAPKRLARPLTVPEIRQIVDAIDRGTPIGARDAVIILLGYASAMRGSELVALDLGDLELKPGGLLVTIRRSKTDQEQHGQVVAFAHGCQAVTDPVAALAEWLRIRGHQPGPLFSRIWCSRVSDQVLGNHVVARMLRERAVAAGLDGTRITAHSLRAGHATAAALAGVPLIRIAAQTRHKDLNVLVHRYIRPLEGARHHLEQGPRPMTAHAAVPPGAAATDDRSRALQQRSASVRRGRHDDGHKEPENQSGRRPCHRTGGSSS